MTKERKLEQQHMSCGNQSKVRRPCWLLGPVLVIAAVVAVAVDAVVQLVADVVTDRIVPSAELVAAVDAGNVVASVELAAAVFAVGTG
jgi:hypothetical protein